MNAADEAQSSHVEQLTRLLDFISATDDGPEQFIHAVSNVNEELPNILGVMDHREAVGLFISSMDIEATRFIIDSRFPPLSSATPGTSTPPERLTRLGRAHGTLIACGAVPAVPRMAMLHRLLDAAFISPPEARHPALCGTLADGKLLAAATIDTMGRFLVLFPTPALKALADGCPLPLAGVKAELGKRDPTPIHDDVQQFINVDESATNALLTSRCRDTVLAALDSQGGDIDPPNPAPAPPLMLATVEALMKVGLTLSIPTELSRRSTLSICVLGSPHQAEAARLTQRAALANHLDLYPAATRRLLADLATSRLEATLSYTPTTPPTESVVVGTAFVSIIKDALLPALTGLGDTPAPSWMIASLTSHIDPAGWLLAALHRRSLFLAVAVVSPLVSHFLSVFAGNLEDLLPQTFIDAIAILAWLKAVIPQFIANYPTPTLLLLFLDHLLARIPQRVAGEHRSDMEAVCRDGFSAWLECTGPDFTPDLAGTRFIRCCWPQLHLQLGPLIGSTGSAVPPTPHSVHAPRKGKRVRQRPETQRDADDVLGGLLAALSPSLRAVVHTVHPAIAQAVVAGSPMIDTDDMDALKALKAEVWRRCCGAVLGLAPPSGQGDVKAAIECCAAMVTNSVMKEAVR